MNALPAQISHVFPENPDLDAVNFHVLCMFYTTFPARTANPGDSEPDLS
jgi:hypothetical protein